MKLLTPLIMVCTLASSSLALGKNDFYLDTEAPAYQQKEKALLVEVARGTASAKPSGPEVTKWIAAYGESKAYQRLAHDYKQKILDVLNVPDLTAEDLGPYKKWQKQNKELLKGIDNYTSGDPSGGGFSEELNWAAVNRKLLKGELLNAEEKQFYQEILGAMETLPKAKGLVFRGIKGTKNDFNRIRPGEKIHRSGFTSTSVSYDVAKSFGYHPKHPVTVIIFETTGGWPVSPLTFGDLEEFEVLLAPGNEVEVTYTVMDPAANTAYIFARQTK